MSFHTDLQRYIRRELPIQQLTISMRAVPSSGTWHKYSPQPAASNLLKTQEHFKYGQTPKLWDSQSNHSSGTPAILIGKPLDCSGHPETLAESFDLTVRNHPKKRLYYKLENGEDRVSDYMELSQDAERILQGLHRQGVRPGDSVILQIVRIDHFVAVFWACILGGIIAVPLKPALHLPTDHVDHHKLEQVWELLNCPLIVGDSDASFMREGNRKRPLTTVQELLQHERSQNRHRSESGDPVLTLFTSGTTGTPKCIRYQNRQVLANIIGIEQHLGLTSDEITLNWMPLYHAGGLLTNHILGVVLGSEQVLSSVERFLNTPITWLDDIETHQVTFTWAPNFAYAQINQQDEAVHSKRWDLSSIRTILNVGQPISARTGKDFLHRLAPFGLRSDSIVPAYGMTEFSGSLCFSRTFDHSETGGIQHIVKDSLNDELIVVDQSKTDETIAFVEIGEVIPGISLRIVNDCNDLLPEARIGKVQLKGDSIITEYFNNAEATNNALTEDGWFESGDLGFVRGGILTLTGREKDVLIMNGRNIYNYEIEAMMKQVYGIDTDYVAAAGISGGESGNDQLLLFYTPQNDDEGLNLFVCQELRGKISRQFGVNPRFIVPVSKEEFPRTPTGKIQRLQLVDLLLQGQFDETLNRIDCLLHERQQAQLIMEEEVAATSIEIADWEQAGQEDSRGTQIQQDKLCIIHYTSEQDHCQEAWVYTKVREYVQTQNIHFDRIEVYRQPHATETTSVSSEQRQFLEKAFQMVLGLTQVTSHDDFFQLGGDSLRMTRLLSMIASEYGVVIPVQRFFRQATIEGILHELQHAKPLKNHLSIPAQQQRTGKLPLTLKQKSQWVLHMIAPDSAFYTNTFSIHFTGVFHVRRLQNALQTLMMRHEALRIRFGIQDGEPYQYVAEMGSDIEIRKVDLGQLQDNERQVGIRAEIEREANLRFDLVSDACLRLCLIDCGTDKHILIVSMHHIMSDGWSVEIFTHELVQLYNSEVEESHRMMAKPSVSYSDYVLWQSSMEQDNSSPLWEQRAYWINTLNRPLPIIQVPCDFPYPEARTYKGNTIERIVDPQLTSMTLMKANQSGATLFMFLFSLYAYLIHRFTRQAYIPIGTVMSNRTRAEVDHLIGFVANTVILPVEFSEDMTFEDLLEQVKGMSLDAYQHQEVPIELLLPDLAYQTAPGSTPGFQVMFTLQNEFTHQYQLQDVSVQLMIEAGNTSKYDLILHVYEESDILRLRMEYNTDLYRMETMHRLLQFYLTMLEGVVEH
ncbi:condensation domain-containing protein [Paenibacillus xylanilyticus]|uniref:condensation domain-containing protein n=1 Tax=Paenibacillus xylanilyticus TaxID=248903 RepID=UPI0039A0A095